jgi:hypothetical protein
VADDSEDSKPIAANHLNLVVLIEGYCSKAKIRFQSLFMLMIVQPCFLAMSYIA